MRPYEVMAIFEATTDPTVIQGVLDQALDLIRSTGGIPGAIDRWGKRTFAYEVNHKREGYYVVVEFTSGTQTVADLDRMLGLADEVVHRAADGLIRVGRQPPVAEPSDPGVGGGHILLRRGVLARNGRERQRDPDPRRAGDGCRAAGATQLGDPGGRQALQGRSGG